MADVGPVGKIKISPPSTIYTVFVILATGFVLFGTLYMAWLNHTMLGTWFPTGP